MNRWSYLSDIPRELPTGVNNALQSQLPNIRLHITMPTRTVSRFGHVVGYRSPQRTFSPESFPTCNLASLTFDYTRLDQANQASFNQLIVSVKQLQTFRAHDSTFKFAVKHGKLPALTCISLSENWPYTLKEVPYIWDFSRLKDVNVQRINIEAFCQSVSTARFPALEKFAISERRIYIYIYYSRRQ
jgi:hypothetical protein